MRTAPETPGSSAPIPNPRTGALGRTGPETLAALLSAPILDPPPVPPCYQRRNIATLQDQVLSGPPFEDVAKLPALFSR